MVLIECPHCSEDIEMDDDAIGLFDCPYCDNEYEWGEEEDDVVYQDNSLDVEGIVTAAYSLLLLILIIVGFGSTSWYSITESHPDFGFESESEFGLSETVSSSDERGFGYAGSGSYESLESSNNANANELREFCEEFDSDECDTMTRMVKEKADWYGSWDSSGMTMKVFLYLALFSSIALLCIKGAVLLNQLEKLELSEEWSNRLIPSDIICSIATASILILGCLIYAIICPELTKSMFNGMPRDISSGLGSMWWTIFLFSLGSLVVPIKKIISVFS